jgi:Sulfotransferase family
MIISHINKYLFVELPLTGSTAIRKELCQSYDGMPILCKHATYEDFRKTASSEEKGYFVFSCIRNPLDTVVSSYFKYRTNHKGRFTDPRRLARNNGVAGYFDNKIFDFLRNPGSDFTTFFLKFYKIPYNNWASLSHQKFNFIIRFENLQDDFARALTLIGIKPKRLLPLLNKTSMKDRDFLSYYTPRTIRRAKRVFGPFMHQWGYKFPPAWGSNSVPWWNRLEFEFFNLFRHFYWRHLRFRI